MRERQRPIETLTEAEAAALLDAASSKATVTRNPSPSKIGTRNRALLGVLYFAGLRISEALSLQVKDLDLRQRQIHVLRGKGGKRRVAKIIGAGVPLLEAWLELRRDLGIHGSRPLFCTLEGGPLSDVYCRSMIQRARQRAGIEKRVHLHSLRHSHAVFLAEQLIPMNKIQKQLGHSSLGTTSAYLNSITAADLDDIAELDWGAV